MLNERKAVAENVADQLHKLENIIDDAIASAGRFNALLPASRTQIKLSAVVGQDALESASDTLSMLVSARKKIIETHEKLARTKDEIGLRAIAVGGGMLKPSTLEQKLEIVSNKAA